MSRQSSCLNHICRENHKACSRLSQTRKEIQFQQVFNRHSASAPFHSMPLLHAFKLSINLFLWLCILLQVEEITVNKIMKNYAEWKTFYLVKRQKSEQQMDFLLLFKCFFSLPHFLAFRKNFLLLVFRRKIQQVTSKFFASCACFSLFLLFEFSFSYSMKRKKV